MGWNAKTTKQLLTRSGTINGQLFTLPLISMVMLLLLGFPSELSNNSSQRMVPQLWKGQQTMAKAKCLFYASLFEPLSQDSYKTQSGSLYEFLLSVQLGLTSNWDDTHCSEKGWNEHMYIGWHCLSFSFTSTSKHENSDYNIANFWCHKTALF